jgi:hypothetical protein
MFSTRSHAQPDVRQLSGGHRARPGRGMEQGGGVSMEGPVSVG